MITLGVKLPSKLTERTIFWIEKTAQRIQARAFAALRPLGMDPRHYVVLRLLEEVGPISQRTMSLDLTIDPTIMDGMEREFFHGLSETERAHLTAILRRLNEPAPGSSSDLAHETKREAKR